MGPDNGDGGGDGDGAGSESGGDGGGGDGDSSPSSTGRSNCNMEETQSLILDKYSAACALSNGRSEGARLWYNATISSVYTLRKGCGVLGVLAI